MARYTGPKFKLSRRAGINITGATSPRLEQAIYRLGYARTRPMARQIVSHAHTRVNGRRVNIPSYLVKPGDVLELAPKAQDVR